MPRHLIIVLPPSSDSICMWLNGARCAYAVLEERSRSSYQLWRTSRICLECRSLLTVQCTHLPMFHLSLNTAFVNNSLSMMIFSCSSFLPPTKITSLPNFKLVSPHFRCCSFITVFHGTQTKYGYLLWHSRSVQVLE